MLKMVWFGRRSPFSLSRESMDKTGEKRGLDNVQGSRRLGLNEQR